MSTFVDIQIATEDLQIPSEADFQLWVDSVLIHQNLVNKEITVRIVDEDEIQQLNQQFRGKNNPTNVLSFPFEIPDICLTDELQNEEGVDNYLGDLIICTQVVAKEAKQQNKQNLHHWAHMIVHGTLHLLGYDHIEDNEASVMESIEISILQKLAIDDPY